MFFINKFEETRKVRGSDGVLSLFEVCEKLVLSKIACQLSVSGNK